MDEGEWIVHFMKGTLECSNCHHEFSIGLLTQIGYCFWEEWHCPKCGALITKKENWKHD